MREPRGGTPPAAISPVPLQEAPRVLLQHDGGAVLLQHDHKGDAGLDGSEPCLQLG